MPETITGAKATARALRAATAAQRQIDLEARPVTYRLVRSHRRTIAIHIGPSGIETRAPHRAAIAEVEGFMRQKQRWILERLADLQSIQRFNWEHGARLPLLGGEVVLIDSPDQTGIVLENGSLLIGRPGRGRRPEWRPRVLEWLRTQALSHFAQRAEIWARQLDVAVPAVHLSNAAARWGSCTRHHSGFRVRLHWKLYLLPVELIDYVVTHELAHMRELNHSPRFWSVVAQACPDYSNLRRELNRRGKELPVL